MINYKNGKVYKIINTLYDNEERIYVGSTCNKLCVRMALHRGRSKTKKERKLYKETNEYGWDKFIIVLLENYPCNSRDELRMKEQEWITKLHPYYNLIRAYRTDKEQKQYYEDNKEQILQQKKLYKLKNKSKYQCLMCGYFTYIKRDLTRHLNTDKHNNKIIIPSWFF
jgi:group I intron endonuclease